MVLIILKNKTDYSDIFFLLMNPNNSKNDIIRKCDEEFNLVLKKYTEEYEKCRERISLFINKNLMNMVGNDLYDYNKINAIKSKENIIFQITQLRPGHPKYKYRTKYSSLHSFENSFIVGEKYILYKVRYTFHKNQTYAMSVTNYGRMLLISEYQPHNGMIKHDELDFWISMDYIYIIQSMINQYRNDNNSNWLRCGLHTSMGTHSKLYETVKKILVHLRDNLLNGKYLKNNLDIKFMDVYKQKKEIDDEQKELEKQRKEITLQYQRINQERKDLREQKEKLARIATKIKMDKAQLAEERKELERQLLTKSDYDDMLGEIDI